MTTLIIEDVGGPDIQGEPLTLDEVKLHLKVENSVDDSLITALMVAAREQAEHLTGRLYTSSARTLRLDAFPTGAIRLPYAPLVSVEGIDYFDADGAEQELETTDLLVVTGAPGYVSALAGESWPATQTRIGAVTVRYTAGTAPEDVPQLVRAWMKLWIGSFYENRAGITLGQELKSPPWLDRLLDRDRVYTVI